MKRRTFLTYAGLAGGMGLFPGILFAGSRKSFDDFKAILLVDMNGGNDALNTFIPTSTDSQTGYGNYVKQRGSGIAIPDTDLMSALRSHINGDKKLEIGAASENPYYVAVDDTKNYMKGFYLLDKHFGGRIAVNAMMPEIAWWMDQGRGAVIQNVGNITGPYTKSDFKSGRGKLPASLFAHNIQNLLAHLGRADNITMPNGWLGKLSDRWGNVNNDPVYRMNINLSGYGIDHAMFGAATAPMNYGYNGPGGLTVGIHKRFDQWINARTDTDQDLFRRLHTELRKRSYTETVVTRKDWEAIHSEGVFDDVTDAYGNAIYRGKKASKEQMGMSSPINDRAVESFKTAAKLIAIAKRNGFARIAISITIPGFDQHGRLTIDHGVRIRGVSVGMDAFMRAMDAKGWLDEVAVVTLSDFSRTTAGNSNGSDHAWGGAQFVLGAVNAGNYGAFPDLTVGGDQDISKRGRIIPTTSYSQYYGKILKWFGATDDEIDYALPELKRFASAPTASALDFMKNT